VSGAKYCHKHPISLVFMLTVNVLFIVIFGRIFQNKVLKDDGQKQRVKPEKVKST
jgi:hypothetical protein